MSEHTIQDLRKRLAEAETKLAEASTDREERLRHALAFARSVILCGEPWTTTCDEKINFALGLPRETRGTEHREAGQGLAADTGGADELVDAAPVPDPRGCAMPGCCAAVERIGELEAKLAAAERDLERRLGVLETAWTIIANARDWLVDDDQCKIWVEAAKAWRDKYHNELDMAATTNREAEDDDA